MADDNEIYRIRVLPRQENANGQEDTGPQPGDPGPQPQRQRRVDPRYKGLVHVDRFMEAMRPPSYVLDGVIQRGCIYSLTGRTGAGKTATSLLISSATAWTGDLGGRKVHKGSVLFLAGENPDNVRVQWYGLRAELGLEGANVPLFFHDGAFSIEAEIAQIQEEAASIENLTLVITDTLMAFFPGDNDNDNVQMCAAARALRELTALPGNPTVLVPCHPVKNATRDNMVPRGGSAFMNEMDGNLAMWRDDDVTEVYSHGKHRGVPFEPLRVQLVRTEPQGLVDQYGRQMPCTVARPLLHIEAEQVAKETESQEDRALAAIKANPKISQRALAERLGYTHHSTAGRLVEKLKQRGWLKSKGRGLALTALGEGVLNGE